MGDILQLRGQSGSDGVLRLHAQTATERHGWCPDGAPGAPTSMVPSRCPRGIDLAPGCSQACATVSVGPINEAGMGTVPKTAAIASYDSAAREGRVSFCHTFD